MSFNQYELKADQNIVLLQHPQPPFEISFEHPTYICPTCGQVLENIALYQTDNTKPTYSEACSNCHTAHYYMDYNVVFRGQRVGVRLNSKQYYDANAMNLCCYIEEAYDPTKLVGDEGDKFHQDDAARVSMKMYDIIVAVRECPTAAATEDTSKAEGEKGTNCNNEMVVQHDKSFSSTTLLPCRELIVTSGISQGDLLNAIRSWRRPIEFTMRRPKSIRFIRRQQVKAAVTSNVGSNGKGNISSSKDNNGRTPMHKAARMFSTSPCAKRRRIFEFGGSQTSLLDILLHVGGFSAEFVKELTKYIGFDANISSLFNTSRHLHDPTLDPAVVSDFVWYQAPENCSMRPWTHTRSHELMRLMTGAGAGR